MAEPESGGEPLVCPNCHGSHRWSDCPDHANTPEPGELQQGDDLRERIDKRLQAAGIRFASTPLHNKHILDVVEELVRDEVAAGEAKYDAKPAI